VSQIDEILDVVAEVTLIDRSKLVPEVKIVDLGITSLDMVEVICTLEDKHGIELPYNANMNFQGFRTLGDVIRMVEETLAKTNT
jgi:acyl carrier protein